MKFDIKFPEEIHSEKKLERLSVAVEPSLKEAVDKLPTKYKTDNTRRFFKALVEEYKKKNKAS